MAYVILNNGNFFRVAKTEADKNDINLADRVKTIVDISDDDFNSYTTNQKKINISNGNVSFSDIPETEKFNYDEASLKIHFNNFKNLAQRYIKRNPGKQLATQLQDYINYLNTVDTASLTYPLQWEKYCFDNSITFFHKNQIG